DPAASAATAQSRAVSAHPDHRHAYPVAVDHHRHPHDSALVHAPLAAPPAPVVAEPETAPAEPIRFALAGPVFSASPVLSHPIATAQPEAPTFAETDAIGVPARLVASAPAAYPAAARAAGVEADVPVEVVVDAAGHVVDARPLAKSGYG